MPPGSGAALNFCSGTHASRLTVEQQEALIAPYRQREAIEPSRNRRNLAFDGGRLGGSPKRDDP
jgi:hypothetical protein